MTRKPEATPAAWPPAGEKFWPKREAVAELFTRLRKFHDYLAANANYLAGSGQGAAIRRIAAWHHAKPIHELANLAYRPGGGKIVLLGWGGLGIDMAAIVTAFVDAVEVASQFLTPADELSPGDVPQPARIEQVINTLAKLLNEPDDPPGAAYLGDGRYRINEKSVVLNGAAAGVMAHLVQHGSASIDQLREHCANPSAVLTNLLKQHPEFSQHVFLPRVKGKGGYSTSIRIAKEQ